MNPTSFASSPNGGRGGGYGGGGGGYDSGFPRPH
jgi:hypothetical protein